MKNSLHVGSLIQAYLAQNRLSKSALARKLQIDPSNLEIRLSKSSMRTDFLLKLSLALEHNFFADLLGHLPKELSLPKSVDPETEARIAALELEIQLLQREREVLTNLIAQKLKP